MTSQLTIVGNRGDVQLTAWLAAPSTEQPWSWECGACGHGDHAATKPDAQVAGITHIESEHLR